MTIANTKQDDPLQSVADIYTDHFKQFGLSLATVECPKLEQMPIRFGALVRNLSIQPGDSLLDYGCGLGHLLEYARSVSMPVEYSGVDLVGDFIASNRDRFPGVDFAQIRGPSGVMRDYDHIVLSGVFGIRYVDDIEGHFAIVRQTLSDLFKRTKKTLAVNFMTDMVDFMQLKSFHLHPGDCCRFIQQSLSRRVVVDQSYMPFEYTVTVHKNDTFRRPAYIY